VPCRSKATDSATSERGILLIPFVDAAYALVTVGCLPLTVLVSLIVPLSKDLL